MPGCDKRLCPHKRVRTQCVGCAKAGRREGDVITLSDGSSYRTGPSTPTIGPPRPNLTALLLAIERALGVWSGLNKLRYFVPYIAQGKDTLSCTTRLLRAVCGAVQLVHAARNGTNYRDLQQTSQRLHVRPMHLARVQPRAACRRACATGLCVHYNTKSRCRECAVARGEDVPPPRPRKPGPPRAARVQHRGRQRGKRPLVLEQSFYEASPADTRGEARRLLLSPPPVQFFPESQHLLERVPSDWRALKHGCCILRAMARVLTPHVVPPHP